MNPTTTPPTVVINFFNNAASTWVGKGVNNKGFVEIFIISKMGSAEKKDNGQKTKADGCNDDSSRQRQINWLKMQQCN